MTGEVLLTKRLAAGSAQGCLLDGGRIDPEAAYRLAFVPPCFIQLSFNVRSVASLSTLAFSASGPS